MTDAPFTVFVVDDDVKVLKALKHLLFVKRLAGRFFKSVPSFLAQLHSSANGCVVLDLSMPGSNRIDLAPHFPVIFLTSNGDIQTCVQAMKAGAVDFLTKPVNTNLLIEAIHRARGQAESAQRVKRELEVARSKFISLTRREREVLEHVVAGRRNKEIAQDLGTVENTIKLHRHRAMRKVGVSNVPDLVRLAEQAGVGPYRVANSSGEGHGKGSG